MSFSVHHWRRLDLALAEIKQTLTEKGFIYMSDLRRDAPDPAVELVVSLLNEKQTRAFLNSVRAAYTIEELSALVQQAGLSHVRVEPEKFCRKTTARNLRELRRSPMRGISQATLNLRLVTKGP